MTYHAFERAEIDEFWQRWLEANRLAEDNDHWEPLADFYGEDSNYGWMYTPDEHFMAIGREEIRKHALGTEMFGMDGWRYEYMSTIIDPQQGMIVGFWRQQSGILDDDGHEIGVQGLGGSWFGLAPGAHADGGIGFAWQRDWFDLGSTAHTYLGLVKDNKAKDVLLERMHMKGMDMPGHYRLADLPSTVWPPPVADTAP